MKIMTTQEIQQHLLLHDVKPSVQRMAIMEYLVKNRIHPTVDTVYSHLSPSMPTLSRTTVYNTLKLLVAQGAILAITIDEKNVRYDANTSQHGHFKCRQCGAIYDLAIEPYTPALLESYPHLSIEETHIYCVGVCDHCNRTKN